MPIDFRQVAAPSFSDSNTLVALAAKQQEEAMAGIQGAWTGAMDAVGNRVQGEMEGIANQASFSQLTDPTQRAALDQEIMAANTLGMGNVRDINKYVDSRRGVQLGLLDTVNRVDRETQLEDERVADKTVNDASWFLADRYNQIEAEEDEGKKTLLQQATDQELQRYGLTDFQLSKATQLADQQNQKQRIANFEEQVKALGPEATAAQIAAVWQNTNASQINTALAVDKHTNGGKGNALATKRKFADSLELQGSIKDDGTPNYDVLKQSLDNRIARSAIEQERVDPDNMSYDQYLMKSDKLLDQKLGTAGRATTTKGLQSHFRWAEENGAGYSEKEKILITEGLLTGSIKMNLFTDNFIDNFRDNQENIRIGEAIAKTHLPRVETEFNTKRMQAGQDAFDPIIKLLTSENVPPDQILTNLGITSLDHPQAKYLPENMKKALELLVTTNDAAFMNSTPDGTGVGKTRQQIAEEQAPKVDIDVGKLVGNPNTIQQQYNGPLRNTNTATTTEDLVAVGKANNVGKAPTTTNRPSNQKGNISNLVTKSGKTIPRDNVTPQMAKEANVKMVNGKLKWEDRFKGKTMETVYGEKIKINNVKDLERFIQVNYSSHVKEIDNVLANNGKSKYKYPADLSKIDKNHPLAHPESDDPKNFVPYDQRNYDGSRKNKKPYKYSSYDTYVKLTLNKKLGRKNK